MLKQLLLSLRPKQWTKNILVFAGIIFSINLLHPVLLLRVSAGFVLFCALTGAMYLFNDITDLRQDRLHPLKSKRPLASGRLPVPVALWSAVFLTVCGCAIGFILDAGFGLVAVSYVCITLAYSLFLKHVAILDLITIAIGFVLRAAAGAAIIHVTISSWLLICTIFLALFLTMGKRRHELVLLGKRARSHRPILEEYSTHLLDQMIAVVTASTVMAYTLYTTAPETVEKFGTRNLVFTTPFVLYGIFRYLYLMHQKNMGGSPEQILLRDKPLLVNLFLYFVVTSVILYFK
ncbi:MAG TPA: decaprenyl-phosphate phosphoribosyltransferase [bacterium]